MYKFCFFLKTYAGDQVYLERLVGSFHKYNKQKIPMIMACPSSDINLFQKYQCDLIKLIPEESICTEVFIEDSIYTAGYLNQEIYKLAFWEINICENYMCLDSDALFLREFKIDEFMCDEDTPYTQLIEDKELEIDPFYSAIWKPRRECIRKIEDAIEFHPKYLKTCHGFQIFSCKALKSLKEEFMIPRGYSYKDLIEISPYEFSWYNLWVQKSHCIPVVQIEPLFRCVHLSQQHILENLRGETLELISRAYIGVIVNSNFAQNREYNNIKKYKFVDFGMGFKLMIKNFFFYGMMIWKKIGYIILRDEQNT